MISNSKNKIIFFLATKKGFYVLSKLLKSNRELIGAVVSFEEIGVLDVYHSRIHNLCKTHDIDFFWWKNIKDSILNLVGQKKISIAIAIGWKYLIPLTINSALKYGLIIFHDSLLPKYRGFAPTPTAMLCGDEDIGVSVLFAGSGADNGDIILQEKAFIGKDIYIEDAINIQAELYWVAMQKMISLFEKDEIISIKQDESKVIYSIWRNEEDCMINWNDRALDIYNLIRAVGFPYLGAYTFFYKKKIIIKKAKLVEDICFAKRDYGKIWEIRNNCPTVVCGEGLLSILEAHYENNEKVVFDKLRTRLSNKSGGGI